MVLLMVAAVAGCSFRVSGNQPLPGQPLVERIPVAVAVHYPPDFRKFTEEWKPESLVTVSIPIGEMSAKMFDIVLPAMFNVISHLEEIPPSGSTPSEVIAVVEISLERLDLGHLYGLHPVTSAALEYRIRILSPDGEERVAWTFGATTELRGIHFMNMGERARSLTQKAMRHAAAGLVTDYCCQEDFLAWLYETGVTPPECGRPCDSR